MVDNEPDDSGFVSLPFLANGFPNENVNMSLQVISRLPRDSKAFIEIPIINNFKTLRGRLPGLKIERKNRTVLVPINKQGKLDLGKAIFPSKARWKMRLLINIPKDKRKNAYNLYIKQLYSDEELGRITWRLQEM
jgi:hypothetical protein